MFEKLKQIFNPNKPEVYFIMSKDGENFSWKHKFKAKEDPFEMLGKCSDESTIMKLAILAVAMEHVEDEDAKIGLYNEITKINNSIKSIEKKRINE